MLHRLGCHRLLNRLSEWRYRSKGHPSAKARWHEDFRAYEYHIDGRSYLSLGPGWNACFSSFSEMLLHSFCDQYKPVAGDCVVDLGAGLGEEALVFAAWVGETGRVHAFEANPVTFKGLQYLCNVNHLTQIIPYPLAIYKEDGYVTIEDNPGNYLTNSIHPGKRGQLGFRVEAVTLDGWVERKGIRQIDFLKCNIEGAEQYLIEGMQHSLPLIRNLCISCHDFRHVRHQHGEFFMTKAKVVSFLEENGYEVTMRHTGHPVIDDYVYARRI